MRKAVARARLIDHTDPTLDMGDQVLRLEVKVPSDNTDGDRILLTILNGFEDTLNLMGTDFAKYICDTGNLKTGQTVRVGLTPAQQRTERRAALKEAGVSWWQRIWTKA